MLQSPLNYTGGKYKLLPQILPLFPKHLHVFVDLFCGGCNVGCNVQSRQVIFNDCNSNLLSIYQTLKSLKKECTFQWIYEIIDHYNPDSIGIGGVLRHIERNLNMALGG